MTQEKQAFWSSGTNLRWVVFAVTLLILHLIIHWKVPDFAPPALHKPLSIRLGLAGELIAVFVILGACINGITIAIPSLKKPQYSQDGLLSLNSPIHVERADWSRVGCILVEFAIFVATWIWLWA